MPRNPPKADTSAVPEVETNVSAKNPLTGYLRENWSVGDGPKVNTVPEDRSRGAPRTTAAEAGAESKRLRARIPRNFCMGRRLRWMYTQAVRADSRRDARRGAIICEQAARATSAGGHGRRPGPVARPPM